MSPDPGALITALSDSPALLAAAAGAALLLLAAGAPRPPNRDRRDPVRRFSGAQRQAGFVRCGGRCEATTLLGTRCPRAATEGDHWFPHARGGATSLDNFVGLCARCNRRKSARIPSRAATAALAIRRGRYPQWPPGTPREPGAWTG